MKITPISSGSIGNCYIISDGQTTLLLDAGIPIGKIQIATRFNLSTISAALITHRHGDHSKSCQHLAKRGVDIYANADTIEFCGLQHSHRGIVIGEEQQVTIGTFTVKALSVQHDVPCFAYLIYSNITKEKLLYLTDAQYNPYVIDGLTHILIEANFDEETSRNNVGSGVIHQGYKDRVWQTHMSIETLIDMFKVYDTSKLQQVYLIHLSDKNALADEFKLRVQKATGAEVIVC